MLRLKEGRKSMAKYEVTHTCGHTRTVQLFGKMIEREHKIEWMESQECPQCWGAKKCEEEAKKPITATIQTNGLDTDTKGNVLAEIILTGGTINKKEEIKAMGYHWGEVRGGVMDMLSTSVLQKAWIKVIPLKQIMSDKTNSLPEEGIKIKNELQQLEAKIINKISPLDAKFVKNKLIAKEKTDQAIAELSKPERPYCVYKEMKGTWNGKVYGNEKYGYKIYIDGKEYSRTLEEAKEIKTYISAKEKYNVEIDKIKAGTNNA
jgi:hypothetical protein